MNKVYTSLEQSKKLAEILPPESADMEYMFLKRDGSKVSNVPFVKDGFEEPECCYIFIPCWSLAALLSVLPKRIPHNDAKYIEDRKDWTYSWILTSECLFYQCSILLENGGRYDDVFAEVCHQDNPVDACYEMIVYLNELKLL